VNVPNDLLKTDVAVVNIPKKRTKTAVKEPPAVQLLLTHSAEIMKELTDQFIEAKDLNSRAKIRAKMKAILDFASVDTSYPAVGTGEKLTQNDPLGWEGNQGQPAIGGVRPIPGSENII
jgi:hypothetical protein